MKPEVTVYSWQSRGKHVAWYSQVRFEDGQIIRFMARLSNREAVKQATYQRHKTRLQLVSSHA